MNASWPRNSSNSHHQPVYAPIPGSVARRPLTTTMRVHRLMSRIRIMVTKLPQQHTIATIPISWRISMRKSAPWTNMPSRAAAAQQPPIKLQLKSILDSRKRYALPKIHCLNLLAVKQPHKVMKKKNTHTQQTFPLAWRASWKKGDLETSFVSFDWWWNRIPFFVDEYTHHLSLSLALHLINQQHLQHIAKLQKAQRTTHGCKYRHPRVIKEIFNHFIFLFLVTCSGITP